MFWLYLLAGVTVTEELNRKYMKRPPIGQPAAGRLIIRSKETESVRSLLAESY
jgi:hypothetical protein